MSSELHKKTEDAWFSKHEKELIERARLRQLAEAEREESEKARKLRELHQMHCPKCGHKMVEIDIKGIAVDECRTCRGVFFDGGELDLLLEKSAADQKGFFRKLAKTVVPGL